MKTETMIHDLFDDPREVHEVRDRQGNRSHPFTGSYARRKDTAMTWRWQLSGILFLVLLLVPAIQAGYMGDNLTVVDHSRITGDLLVTAGDSRYSGELGPGGTFTITTPLSLPAGARIQNATWYLFWTWSHTGTTGTGPSLKTELAGSVLTPARSYTDQKGNPPYDYPSGTFAYDLSGKVQPGEPVAITVTNTGSNQGIAISGGVLVVTYEAGSSPVDYWIAEGADMIYATEGVTEEQATTHITFDGVPEIKNGMNATLLSVVPSGSKGKNKLTVNGHTFPGLFNGTPYADLAMTTTNLRGLLIPGKNTVDITDQGDYMVPGVFVLKLNEESPVTGVQTQQSPLPAGGALLVLGALALARGYRLRR